MEIQFPELKEIQALWMQAMRAGDFEEAWRQTDRIEVRRRACERRGGFEWQPHFLLWNGELWDRKEVVVYCNHGLGDTIQFLRFLPWLRERARRVTLRAQPALLQLLAADDRLGKVVNGWSDLSIPRDSVPMEIMELPYVFRVNEQSLPRDVPYLKTLVPRDVPSKPGLLALLGRDRLRLRGGGEEFKVGIHWVASAWDPSRSIPLAALRSLRRLHGITFYSLQQGEAAAQWHNPYLPMVPLSRQTKNMVHAAAAICQLDLVITVDSIIAHLAGALGRPVWLLLKHQADWRWMEARSDSPWYPSMRLFRQERPGNWNSVGEAITAAVEELWEPQQRV